MFHLGRLRSLRLAFGHRDPTSSPLRRRYSSKGPRRHILRVLASASMDAVDFRSLGDSMSRLPPRCCQREDPSIEEGASLVPQVHTSTAGSCRTSPKHPRWNALDLTVGTPFILLSSSVIAGEYHALHVRTPVAHPCVQAAGRILESLGDCTCWANQQRCVTLDLI